MTLREITLGPKPEPITRGELEGKLAHLTAELSRAKARGILVSQEGAMRWLTGIRHQIIDIAPDAPSPVQALVRQNRGLLDITFLTTRIEMPRARDQLPEVFAGLPGVEIAFQDTQPSLTSDILAPGMPGFAETMGRVVRPLLGGLSGDPYAKLSWLSAAVTAIMAATAHELQPGMNGAEVRALLLYNLLRRDVDCNLVLVALAGQENHYHPLWDARYRLEKDCWVKLVAGGRYAEMIVSATIMVRFGSRAPDEARRAYRALQEAAVEYADCYRNGAVEGDIYQEIGRRFDRVGQTHDIPGFGESAYAHHTGGPTSPIGNRDHLIEKGGRRAVFPWMQFAINPVEVLFNTKVEAQGIVLPEGAPHMLDGSLFTPPELMSFREVVSVNGTRAKIAEVIER